MVQLFECHQTMNLKPTKLNSIKSLIAFLRFGHVNKCMDFSTIFLLKEKLSSKHTQIRRQTPADRSSLTNKLSRNFLVYFNRR